MGVHRNIVSIDISIFTLIQINIQPDIYRQRDTLPIQTDRSRAIDIYVYVFCRERTAR